MNQTCLDFSNQAKAFLKEATFTTGFLANFFRSELVLEVVVIILALLVITSATYYSKYHCHYLENLSYVLFTGLSALTVFRIFLYRNLLYKLSVETLDSGVYEAGTMTLKHLYNSFFGCLSYNSVSLPFILYMSSSLLFLVLLFVVFFQYDTCLFHRPSPNYKLVFYFVLLVLNLCHIAFALVEFYVTGLYFFVFYLRVTQVLTFVVAFFVPAIYRYIKRLAYSVCIPHELPKNNK